MKPLRIAIVGSRGIPARYGGFETLAEELSARLVERGFRVTVYCRDRGDAAPARFRGVERVVLPTLPSKYLDTPVHTLLSCLDAALREFDAALVVNSANAIFLPLLRWAGIPTALNVDGLEKQRAKWGAPGRLVYALSERLAARWPTALIADAEVIAHHYRERHGAPSTVISYGVDPEPLPPGETLERLGLRPREYFLYVSRFEPENNPHRVVAAYREVGGELPLVMVGGAPYAGRFIRSFTGAADPRVLFPGPIYGDGYRELLSHALAYIQATEVGGTHPALVEAMGFGNCLVVNDVPEHREVAAESARYFSFARPGSLAAQIEAVREDPAAAAALGAAAAARARELYRWEDVVDRYQELCERLARA